MRVFLCAVALSLVANHSMAADVSACIQGASNYHRVNPQILEAILEAESSMRPGTINKNDNNSVDFGLAGINSIHLKELSKWGLGVDDLLNPCVSIYVGAWHLSKKIQQYGNTWFAIGAYHSITPEKNHLYQVRIFEKLRMIQNRAYAQSKEAELHAKQE